MCISTLTARFGLHARSLAPSPPLLAHSCSAMARARWNERESENGEKRSTEAGKLCGGRIPLTKLTGQYIWRRPYADIHCLYSARQYEFSRVPFGLTNSPGVFKKLINAILRNIVSLNVVLTYLDDLKLTTAVFFLHCGCHGTRIVYEAKLLIEAIRLHRHCSITMHRCIETPFPRLCYTTKVLTPRIKFDVCFKKLR